MVQIRANAFSTPGGRSVDNLCMPVPTPESDATTITNVSLATKLFRRLIIPFMLCFGISMPPTGHADSPDSGDMTWLAIFARMMGLFAPVAIPITLWTIVRSGLGLPAIRKPLAGPPS